MVTYLVASSFSVEVAVLIVWHSRKLHFETRGPHNWFAIEDSASVSLQSTGFSQSLYLSLYRCPQGGGKIGVVGLDLYHSQ
jgi:hypothetical protein